jgi:hypothetical protein
VRWPSLFDGVDSTTENWIVDQMHIVNTLFIIYLVSPIMDFILLCYALVFLWLCFCNFIRERIIISGNFLRRDHKIS